MLSSCRIAVEFEFFNGKKNHPPHEKNHPKKGKEIKTEKKIVKDGDKHPGKGKKKRRGKKK